MAAKKRAVRKRRVTKKEEPVAWYVGYSTPEKDRDKVIKIAERIHSLRRSVAVAAFQYYQLNDITISDHEYECRVLELHYLQLRYPKIASTVLFMPNAFSTDDFVSTGFHLVEYTQRGDFGGEAIPGIANQLLRMAQDDNIPIIESKDVNKRISFFREKIKELQSR